MPRVRRPQARAQAPDGPRFTCTRCGDCCTGSQVVRLTRHDLVLMAAHLKLPSVGELRSQGFVSIVRETVGPGLTVWRPRIRFRTRPLVQCPFLVNHVGPDGAYQGLCSLHPHAKPLVCALSPLARDVDDSGSGTPRETWSFVPPVDGCPGVGRGEPLKIQAPEDLKKRLDSEVQDLRNWLDQSEGCEDEAKAWERLTGPWNPR